MLVAVVSFLNTAGENGPFLDKVITHWIWVHPFSQEFKPTSPLLLRNAVITDRRRFGVRRYLGFGDS